jgi:Na+-driven multidrug efflux pump
LIPLLVFLQVLSLVLMKYLQTQNMMLAPAVTTLISFVLNIGFNAGFIALFGFVVRSGHEECIR